MKTLTKPLTKPNKNEILEIASQMTANHFLLEFGEIAEPQDMDNLLDANEGICNIAIDVKDGRKNETIYILYVDGKYSNYSY